MKEEHKLKIKKNILIAFMCFICILLFGSTLTVYAKSVGRWITLADPTEYRKYTLEKFVFPEKDTDKQSSSSSSGSSSSSSSTSSSSSSSSTSTTGSSSSSNSSSGSSSTKKTKSVTDREDCSACSGGRCSRCGGTGKIKRLQAGTRKRVKVKCTSCRPAGSGKCYSCRGKGEK